MLRDLSKLQDANNTEYAGIEVLWAHEKCLVNYHKDVVKKLSKFASKSSEVLEFGAGLGTLVNIWECQNKIKPECLEIDNSLRSILLDRGYICYKSIDDINKNFHIIYTSNVLEHIDDDLAALKKINSKLKTHGYLAIYVPAFMCLYNKFDFSIGHYRRYKKKDLIEKLLKANFKIEECYYVDSLGFFAWLLVKLKRSSNEGQLSSEKSLKIYDKILYPISSFFDSIGLRYLFGKNLLVIAKKL